LELTFEGWKSQESSAWVAMEPGELISSITDVYIHTEVVPRNPSERLYCSGSNPVFTSMRA
uniref:hypothetical protein n=1 Tax=Salmonella enterica TaxID=28901 RepID=UPI0032975D8F